MCQISFLADLEKSLSKPLPKAERGRLHSSPTCRNLITNDTEYDYGFGQLIAAVEESVGQLELVRVMKGSFDSVTLDQILDLLADKVAARIGPISKSPRLMDLSETAVYLGRSISAVTHLVNKGKLPITKLDGKVQVDRLALDKLIEKNTTAES